MTKHLVVRVTRRRTVDIVECIRVDVIVENENSLDWNPAENRARKYIEAQTDVGGTVDWKLESETDRYMPENAGYQAKIETIDGKQVPDPDPALDLPKAPQPQADTPEES